MRRAIVRVVNNCSGEFSEFVFTQEGATCPVGVPDFTLGYTSTELCGNNGAVIAWVIGAEEGVNYIWEYGGTIVHTSTYMQIIKPGTYTVYAGLLGCNNPEPQKITVTQNSGASPGVPIVSVTNGGVLCGGGNVYLRASNVTFPIKWFHNGVLDSRINNPLMVSGASAAGEWFAIQQDGTCGSRISNIVLLFDQTTGSIALPMPIATINGDTLTGAVIPTVCKSGTLELAVINHDDYPTGTLYEWFVNSASVYTGVAPTVYAVSPDASSINIAVQATNNISGCPTTAMSVPITITFTAPAPTTINNGAGNKPICGSTPATLIATNDSGETYEWFKNGVKITTPNAQNSSVNTYRYYATEVGNYTVRYKDIQGCWSQLSTSIAVTQSAAISSLNWLVTPPAAAVIGTQPTYTVVASPLPDSYTWTSSSPTIATVTPVPPGQSASIKFIATGETTISVEAANTCGSKTLAATIECIDGCEPITSGSVNITPNTTVERYLNVAGNPKPDNTTVTFEAGAVGATYYDWYVNSVKQSETSNTFTYTVLPGLSRTDTIYAAARNFCTGPNVAKSTKVLVKIIRDVEPDLSGDYSLSGKICYDINKGNNGTGDCLPNSSRIDDFSNGTNLHFQYTFQTLTGKTFNDLSFRVLDPNGLLASPPFTKTGDIAIIHFNNTGNNIYNKAANTTKTTALKITLIAEYTSYQGVPRSKSIEISVQDCACGCMVKAGATTMLTFMCYNLGADPTKTIEQQMAYVSTGIYDSTVYGAWYQWGRQKDGHEIRTSPSISTQASGANLNPITGQPQGTHAGRFIDGFSDWRTPKEDKLWNAGTTIPVKTVNDPCPQGWRMPTTLEFQKMVYGVANTADYTNLAAVAPSGNKFTWNSSGTQGIKVSVDGVTRLFLPAAGNRNLLFLGPNGINESGIYWSSDTETTYAGIILIESTFIRTGGSSRARGSSVRCVAEY